jgi:hypothetical protein
MKKLLDSGGHVAETPEYCTNDIDLGAAGHILAT